MFIVDFIHEVVGYTTARFALPVLTFGKVRVEKISSSETGFGWLGFKRSTDGSYLCQAPMAGWIGLLPWVLGIILVVTLI